MTYQKKAPDKRLGRPGKIGNETIRFRTSAEMGAQLRAACEKAGIIQSEFCRQAVSEKLTKTDAEIQVIDPRKGDKFIMTQSVKVWAADRVSEPEFPVICWGSAAGKTVSIKDVKSYRKHKKRT